jgi:nucleoside 2-deoxyribosyltransferase
MHTIYVAGPVLGPDVFQPSTAGLPELYEHLASVAMEANVGLELPTYSKELADLPADAFARAIWRRIQEADSMLALIDAPGSHPGSNLSVAGEAHWAAQAGKPVAIVAKDPERVPRLLRALSALEVRALYGVDFKALFRDLRNLTSGRIRGGA